MSEAKKPGRKAIQIDALALQNTIREVETSNTIGNRSQLWAAVEATEWAKTRSPRPLTAQVAMNLAKKFNLNIATPLGKKGREKGSGPIPGAGRKKKTLPPDVVVALNKIVPAEFHKIVEKAAGGSMKAAVKLKCLDCTGYQMKEVRECELKDCSLWSFRPYKPTRAVSLPLAEPSNAVSDNVVSVGIQSGEGGTAE